MGLCARPRSAPIRLQLCCRCGTPLVICMVYAYLASRGLVLGLEGVARRNLFFWSSDNRRHMTNTLASREFDKTGRREGEERLEGMLASSFLREMKTPRALASAWLMSAWLLAAASAHALQLPTCPPHCSCPPAPYCICLPE